MNKIDKSLVKLVKRKNRNHTLLMCGITTDPKDIKKNDIIL